MRIAHGFLAWLFLASLLSACSGKPPGSEFVGGWEPVKPGSGPSFQIARDGQTYLLVDKTGAKFAATYDAQTHVLNVSMGPLGNVPFSYIGSTDHLSAMGDEFKPAKQDGPATAASSAKTPSLDDEAIAFGKTLFAKGMVTCGGKTFMALYSAGSQQANIPAEIRNPTFMIDPMNGNSAGKGDTLNGVDFKGSVDMRLEAFRVYFNHRWSDWYNGDGANAPVQLSIETTESVLILRKHGQWLHDDSYAARGDFVGVRKSPLTCEAIPKGW
jgi:hypothetical protein